MTDVSNASKAAAPPRVLSNSQVLAFIAAQWMRRPWLFAATVVLVMAGVGADLFFPAAAEHLTKAVAGDPAHDLGAVWNAWGLFVAVYVAALAFRNSSFFFMIPFAARNMEDLVNDAFRRVQSFSADWHADTFAGATVRKVTRAMWAYDQVSDVVILMLGPSLLVLIGLSTMMVLRWPLVGLFSYGAVALYIGLSLVLAKTWLRPANLKSNALDSELGAAVADAISSNPTVKSFGAEEREEARFARTVAAWRRATITSWSRGTQTWVLQNLVLVLLQGGLTGVLVLYWSQGKASAGDITFAITAFLLMSGYLRNFGETVRQFQRGMDDAEATAAYMRTPPQVPDRPDARAFRPGAGEIVFDHVGFGYRRQRETIYDDFNLTIRPGERVALVGPTGSGKSTFVKLIQRLYDIQAGRILIDGQDIARVSQELLRRAIAVVPQDPALFHRSIAENIGYARPEATLDQIIAAARQARANDFITRLPDGYDTLVGERGVKLSGGERQRVAIARAFLADAPILVLDEATSSLDVETELLVQAATEALMAGRTTVVIAHRLSTIRSADRILVFQDGRVVEEGRHGDLVARGGAYARLHATAEGAA